jgi:hypothetical protein
MSTFSAWMRQADNLLMDVYPDEWHLLVTCDDYEEACEIAVANLQGRTFYDGVFLVKVVRGLDANSHPVMFLSNGGYQPATTGLKVREYPTESARWAHHLHNENGVRVPPILPLLATEE